MRLYHATTRRSWASIQRDGAILAARAKDRRKAVWLHTASRTAWACLHTVRRHGGRVEDVVVLEVSISRRNVRRHANGLWYTFLDIATAAVGSVVGFQAVSESEVKQ